ncbi:hypothetical protein BU15DRAFT_68172 [Melanogaster broomeanus]|nr:hypothetical protein BU15DRAFT_68172 [Melanogaster broomeanus]
MAGDTPTNSPVDIPLSLADPAILPMSAIASCPNSPPPTNSPVDIPLSLADPAILPMSAISRLSQLAALAVVCRQGCSLARWQDQLGIVGYPTRELIGLFQPLGMLVPPYMHIGKCGEISPRAYRMAGSARDSGISTGESVGVSPAIGHVSTLTLCTSARWRDESRAYRWQDQLGIVGYHRESGRGCPQPLGMLVLYLCTSARWRDESRAYQWRDESLAYRCSWDRLAMAPSAAHRLDDGQAPGVGRGLSQPCGHVSTYPMHISKVERGVPGLSGCWDKPSDGTHRQVMGQDQLGIVGYSTGELGRGCPRHWAC